MNDIMMQLGVGGIFAILVIREVFTFLRSRVDKSSDLDVVVRDVKIRVDELYRWHDVRDEDGTPIWYIRSSMTRSVEQLARSISELETAVRRQAEVLDKLMGADNE